MITDTKPVTLLIRDHVLNECRKESNQFTPAFFDEHILVVNDYAKKLAIITGADCEAVEIASYLHDISAVADITTLARHNAASAEWACGILTPLGYPGKSIEMVKKAILTHVSPLKPGSCTPEELCLSNADAMAQITRPTYWLFITYRILKLNYTDGKQWLLQRINNNWNAITEPAREIIAEEYDLVMQCLKK